MPPMMAAFRPATSVDMLFGSAGKGDLVLDLVNGDTSYLPKPPDCCFRGTIWLNGFCRISARFWVGGIVTEGRFIGYGTTGRRGYGR